MAELLFLFAGMPLLFFFKIIDIPFIPMLCFFALLANGLLRHDRRFRYDDLWKTNTKRTVYLSILLIFIPIAVGMSLLAYRIDPYYFFFLPKSHPLLWVLVLIFYPLISVLPQGLVYRALFFRRYGKLFGSQWGTILASAFFFSLGHILFRNWIAVALSFAGGLLFAYRYYKNNSLVPSLFEHILYGWWLFTCGLGIFFFHGDFH
ncbi:MAG: CPBP family intramembrane metalloprotease [Bacteroidota bacterium]|nr:CPBP family intramembrane metalloprotease [Bacteroidota bacterium]MDP4206587.1 CPBP family intramembrane metalloprotease [Bacteroidota bacterium]